MELQQLYHRIKEAIVAFVIILIIGSVGYKYLAKDPVSYFDGLYMTILTVSTIGFEEVIDLKGNLPGRLFTIFIAFTGIGILTFILSNFAAMFIESDLREKLRVKKMEKKIKALQDHYIICGIGRVGYQTAIELETTSRTFVYSDIDHNRMDTVEKTLRHGIGLTGDCTEDEMLIKLGIKTAKGLFITVGNDNAGLMICLTARQLNPHIRIIARCSDHHNMKKFTTVGADKVISPAFIGGMRIASEMVRPTVTTFLDTMLRGNNPNLRLEEIRFSPEFYDKCLLDIPIQEYRDTLVLAIKEGDKWFYNPNRHHKIKEDSILIVMTSPKDRDRMEKKFSCISETC